MIMRVGVSAPLFILATCGGEIAKKHFSGTPRTPAKDVALCTPLRDRVVSVRVYAWRAGKGRCPLHSLKGLLALVCEDC